MARLHLVRVGALAHVGRFAAVDGTRYPRGAPVIVRTARGLEVGEVLRAPEDDAQKDRADGKLLRGMTAEDELLEARLHQNREAALAACTQRINELGIEAVLVDVELLFDGRSLFFYFLGETNDRLEEALDELAQSFETVAQIRRFSDTLAEGCGPGCGTDQAQGGGCTTCASGAGCLMAEVCGHQAG